jgi:hypothetical protein
LGGLVRRQLAGRLDVALFENQGERLPVVFVRDGADGGQSESGSRKCAKRLIEGLESGRRGRLAFWAVYGTDDLQGLQECWKADFEAGWGAIIARGVRLSNVALKRVEKLLLEKCVSFAGVNSGSCLLSDISLPSMTLDSDALNLMPSSDKWTCTLGVKAMHLSNV